MSSENGNYRLLVLNTRACILNYDCTILYLFCVVARKKNPDGKIPTTHHRSERVIKAKPSGYNFRYSWPGLLLYDQRNPAVKGTRVAAVGFSSRSLPTVTDVEWPWQWSTRNINNSHRIFDCILTSGTDILWNKLRFMDAVRKLTFSVVVIHLGLTYINSKIIFHANKNVLNRKKSFDQCMTLSIVRAHFEYKFHL